MMRIINRFDLRYMLALACVLGAWAAVVRATASAQPATSPDAVKYPHAPKGARFTDDGWFAPRPKVERPPLPKEITRAFVIPIRDVITYKTFDALKRKLIQVQEAKAELVVLDLDTEGGQLAAVLDLTRLLQRRLRHVYTVCYVRTRAFGVGVFLALACDEIVMAQESKLGDAAPVTFTGQPGPREQEKIKSLLRSELRLLARLNGYDPVLAERFVAIEQETWLIRNLRTRELRYAWAHEWKGRVRDSRPGHEGASNPNADWELLPVFAPKGQALILDAPEAKRAGLASRVLITRPGNPLAAVLENFNVRVEPTLLADVEPGPATATAPRRRFHSPADAIETDEGWFAAPKSIRRPPLPKNPDNVFVFPIREEIRGKTFDALQRKVLQARSKKADLIVLDMDTWGGEVGAALDITRLLKTEFGGIYTVCYVRTRAVSAGAMIAMACNEIVMMPVGKFGDCAPISLQGKIEGVEREKIETILRNEFKESAQRNGYPDAVAQCMVSKDLEAWLIRNKETDELRYVLDEEWRGKVDIPPGMADVKSNPQAEWVLLRIVVPKTRILTLAPRAGKELGFVSAIVEKGPADNPFANLLKHFNATGQLTVMKDTWSEKVVEFLTSPVVSSILLLVGMMGIFIELRTPGLGLPGAVAVICFAILFGSRYLTGFAQWWEIALFVLGLGLIAIEVFVTPGFGVMGISGIICCVVGLLAMIVPNPPTELPIPDSELAWAWFTRGVFWLSVAFVAAVIGSAIVSKYLPDIPLARKLFLGPAEHFAQPPVADDSPMMRIKVGELGVVEGMCRPVGKVRFGQEILDAASEGEIIEPGSKVRVLRRDGNRLIVEKA